MLVPEHSGAHDRSSTAEDLLPRVSLASHIGGVPPCEEQYPSQEVPLTEKMCYVDLY